VRHSRSPLIGVLSFAVVAMVTAARPAVATAQDDSKTIEAPPEAAANREVATRGLGALARPEVRIAFGVRRGAIQHLVTKSAFDDVYEAPDDPSELVTLVTVHRFGQRAPGGIRMFSNGTPPTLRPGPSEEPLRLGTHPTIVWDLAERVRIAFGGRARSLPMIDNGIDRPTAPTGALTIEFGDRK
jgi:hypothetical protein